MATITDYLTQLQTDKQTLIDNLVSKGVDATSEDTFTTLAPKVLDLLSRDEAAITNGQYLFYKGNRVEQFDTIMSLLDTTDWSCLFAGIDARNKAEIDLPSLDVSNVTNMRDLFSESYFKSTPFDLDLTNWDVSNCKEFVGMFYRARSFASIDCSSWELTDCSITSMFYQASNATSIKIPKIKCTATPALANARSLFQLFASCSSLTSIDVSQIDTTNFNSFQGMFSLCSNLRTVDVSHFNTESVTSLKSMFHSCAKLETIDLTNFNTNNVNDFEQMFTGCSTLTRLDLHNFTNDNVTYVKVYSMFNGCSSLQFLDIRGFDFTKATSYTNMFVGVPADCEIIVKDDTARTWVLTRRNDFTNIKTVAEL